MDYTIDYLTDKKIVRVKMKGRLNFEIVKRYSMEALKIARHNDCAKFLFDHTETTLEGGINKIHAAGEELQQFGFQNTDRIAIVIANITDDSNLIKQANQNSRLSVLKYFGNDDMDEAINWLLDIK